MGCTGSAKKPPTDPSANTNNSGNQGGQTGEQTAAAEPPVPEVSAEEKAIAQLKLLFESMDMDNDKTVDRTEFQKAMVNNDKIGELIKEAKLNPDAQVLEQLDTNKDGRVSWDEFEEHLKKAATDQVEKRGSVTAADEPVEERAKKRLKELFDSIDTNKDGTVNKDELAAKLNSENSESFIGLLKSAGLNTDFMVLEQMDTNEDGRLTFDEFYDKMKGVAKAEVQATGDVAAAAMPPPIIEDEGNSKSNCC